MSIWDTDKDKVVDCTTPMTYEEYKQMVGAYCRNVAHHEHEQTNEEWFCTLNTEEKAKWLADNFGFVLYKISGLIITGLNKMPETKIEYWKEWLQEEHHAKE